MSQQFVDVQQKLQEVGKGVYAVPRLQQPVKVSISTSSIVLKTYVRELAIGVEDALAMRGARMGYSLSEEELMRYVDFLVYSRVCYVSYKPGGSTQRAPIGPADNYAVPAFLSLALAQVGHVEVPELGLVLEPVFEGAIEWDSEFAERISRLIKNLGHGIGLAYALGYDRNKSGSFEFMTTALIENSVMYHKQDLDPTIAIMSALLAVRGAEAVLHPHVMYGSLDYISRFMHKLTGIGG